MSEELIEVGAETIAVYLKGTGPETVFLLHGGPGVPDYLSPVADKLSQTYRTVRFDQRGTGKSSSKTGDYSLSAHISDLKMIFEALNIERAHVFGHSWGGTLAQLFLARHPEAVDKLFLSNSGIGVGADWKAMEKAVMQKNRTADGFSGFLRLGWYQLQSMLPGIKDSGAQKLMAQVWKNYFDPPSAAPIPDDAWLQGVSSHAMYGTRKAAIETDSSVLSYSLSNNKSDVFVVFGDKDIYGETTNTLFQRFPNGKHFTLKDCGHIPWLQAPERFDEVLKSAFDY